MNFLIELFDVNSDERVPNNCHRANLISKILSSSLKLCLNYVYRAKLVLSF